MTRFASIMGVAAVATLVLLSGCEAAMEKTDYVEKLEGTWEVMELANTVVPPVTMIPTPGTANVEVTITPGEELNTGSFELAVTQITPFTLSTRAAGTIVVDSKNINVTIDSITSVVPLTGDVTALEGQEREIGYTVTDDSLIVTSSLFPFFGIAESITLTKSAAQ